MLARICGMVIMVAAMFGYIVCFISMFFSYGDAPHDGDDGSDGASANPVPAPVDEDELIAA